MSIVPSERILFEELFFAKTEREVEKVVSKYPSIFDNKHWHPLGSNPNNYAIIKNQQANPIAALIEKITNAIDAILMRRAYEEGVDPTSSAAPQSMEGAVEHFFPDHKNWDLKSFRRKQAEEIQVVADGTPRDTSVIIYDNGEGQHHEHFEKT